MRIPLKELIYCVCMSPGLGLSNSDQGMMQAAVSSPAQDMMFTVADSNDLQGISENFVDFVCEGKRPLSKRMIV